MTEYDIKDAWGQSELFYAVKNGLNAEAEMMIDRGADVRTTGRLRKTLWHATARQRSTHVAQILHRLCPDLINERDKRGRTPLDMAIEKSGTELCLFLVE